MACYSKGLSYSLVKQRSLCSSSHPAPCDREPMCDREPILCSTITFAPCDTEPILCATITFAPCDTEPILCSTIAFVRVIQ
uniref:Uncharacterized protein n=1 Tax=Picea sitchensis TaxID=3332 RepID=D5AAP8_PICSI|nr:unknown [Picea sitchensis]